MGYMLIVRVFVLPKINLGGNIEFFLKLENVIFHLLEFGLLLDGLLFILLNYDQKLIGLFFSIG
jgi:hypothetical protein